ncbi:MAG TPA: amidohydrolase family protein [Iamia sp.]|nr:amidohydrolase family protein [Iamia sp.]
MASTEDATAAKSASVWEKMAGVGAPAGPRRKAKALLPDPDPRDRHRPIISVDDHIVEPPDIFEGRLPDHLVDRAPRVIEDEHGNQFWEVGARTQATIGLAAVVGKPVEDWTVDAVRFDEIRKGCWEINSRVHDMDLNGIWASVCFPSALPGFAGRNFSKLPDKELGLALVRAWNQWHIEEWAGPYPDRIVPIQLPWLDDPVVGAEEIRRNAAAGFKAVSFSENPVGHRYPSLHSGHWDPFFQACEETGTVVCLHAGSSTWSPVLAADAPRAEHTTLFAVNSIVAAADWLWSGIPLRYPDLKIVLAEGGASWVPMMVERLDYVLDHSMKGDTGFWDSAELSPSEVFLRSFFFCMLDDPAGVALRHTIGVDHLMVESDYPHSDSTWPDTQPTVQRMLGTLPPDEADRIAYGNAAALFRHPLPPADF